MTRRSLLVVALVAVAAFAIALAYAQRTALAERWLLAQLEARGVSPVALHVAGIDVHGIELRDLAIGAPEGPDLSIATLEARWSLGGLRQGRLDSLRVSGLRLRGELGTLLRGDAETSGPLLLPAPEIELRDARLSIETPEGAAECAFEGRLHTAPDSGIAGDFSVQLEHPLARANGTVVLSGTLEKLEAELLLEGANGALRVEARGSADLPARSGKAELRVAPLEFAPEGLQPATLLPAIEPLLAGLGIEKIAGKVEARGTFALEVGKPKLRLDVALREVGFETAFARVSGLSGAVALRAPPLRTAKGQLVAIARLDAGLTLRGGLIDFQLRPDGVIDVRSTTWQWAGGELRAEDLTLDLEAESTPATLQARDLDLAALLALAAFEGVEGTGRIDGTLPLVRSGDELLVKQGVLRATPEGGTLRYRPSETTRAFAKARPNDLGIAVAAFSNFRYDLLEARIDGDLRGELRIALHIRGANPGFQGGQPIELNLNLEARLADLVRGGVAAYRVPDIVEERLRAFSEKGKK